MCGIAGYFCLDGQPVSGPIIQRMTDLQKHRGPDDQGIALFSIREPAWMEWHETALPGGHYEGAVGFNRLSILDLSSNGHQPMANRDGTIVMVYNGEVYNAFDYKADLAARGHEFTSRTDTEIVLKLYEEYGIETMLEKLNGMFAFCVIDLRQRKIHLARDHFGIKPLYYALMGRTILFASELKSFLMHPSFQPAIAKDNLDEFLMFRMNVGERTLLKNVFQLPPGHRMEINTEGFSVVQYYEIPDFADKKPLSEVEAISGLNDRLDRSVSAQLISDVKVGCQLSGGIDSSLVTHYARMHHHADLDSFSIVFPDPKFSEETWISQVVSLTGTDNHRFMFNEAYLMDHLEQATWHLDQPLNLPNSVAIKMLAQKSRRLVTVLLSGEGADELFGGYSRYYDAALHERFGNQTRWISKAPRLGTRFISRYGLKEPGDVFFIKTTLVMPVAGLKSYYPDLDEGKVIEQRRALFNRTAGEYLSRCSKYDMMTYMADLLIRQDKMTMAHSLENRVPFLDRNLVAYIRSLPFSYLASGEIRCRNGTMLNTKKLLKKLSIHKFGSSFTYRLKSGFPLPLETYFRSRQFEALMEDKILPGLRQRGWINTQALESIWRKRTDPGHRISKPVWLMAALEIWAELFIDRQATRPAVEATAQ